MSEQEKVICEESVDEHASDVYRIRMTSDLFNYIKHFPKNAFKATNGIRICCHNRFSPGFANNKLRLDHLVLLGSLKPRVDRKNAFQCDYNEFVNKLGLLGAAVEEVLKMYQRSHLFHPEISEKQFLSFLAEPDEFKTVFKLQMPKVILKKLVGSVQCERSGLRISISKGNKPGFENGAPNTLYFKPSDLAGEFVIRRSFPGYKKLFRRKDDLKTLMEHLGVLVEEKPKGNPGIDVPSLGLSGIPPGLLVDFLMSLKADSGH